MIRMVMALPSLSVSLSSTSLILHITSEVWVYMELCMCVYVCMYVGMCVYVCVYIYMFVCVYVCMYVCVGVI